MNDIKRFICRKNRRLEELPDRSGRVWEYDGQRWVLTRLTEVGFFNDDPSLPSVPIGELSVRKLDI